MLGSTCVRKERAPCAKGELLISGTILPVGTGNTLGLTQQPENPAATHLFIVAAQFVLQVCQPGRVCQLGAAAGRGMLKHSRQSAQQILRHGFCQTLLCRNEGRLHCLQARSKQAQALPLGAAPRGYANG